MNNQKLTFEEQFEENTGEHVYRIVHIEENGDVHRSTKETVPKFTNWLKQKLIWKKVENGLPEYGEYFTKFSDSTSIIKNTLFDGGWTVDNSTVTEWLEIPQ